MKMHERQIPSRARAYIRVGMVAGAALFLAACAGASGVGGAAPDVEVGERVKARYAALVAKKYETAYGFFTPSFRKSWTYREYMIMRPPVVTYSSAELVSVKCATQEACEVGVNVTYTPSADVRGVPKGLDVSRFNEETWIRVDGQWWFYLPD